MLKSVSSFLMGLSNPILPSLYHQTGIFQRIVDKIIESKQYALLCEQIVTIEKKKLFLMSMMCLMALVMQAQRCAVMEFKAGVGVSQGDVDGISAIFITYFRPSGYTMVERTRIDKVIEEQG